MLNGEKPDATIEEDSGEIRSIHDNMSENTEEGTNENKT